MSTGSGERNKTSTGSGERNNTSANKTALSEWRNYTAERVANELLGADQKRQQIERSEGRTEERAGGLEDTKNREASEKAQDAEVRKALMQMQDAEKANTTKRLAAGLAAFMQQQQQVARGGLTKHEVQLRKKLASGSHRHGYQELTHTAGNEDMKRHHMAAHLRKAHKHTPHHKPQHTHQRKCGGRGC
jgi:hypothetical protein